MARLRHSLTNTEYLQAFHLEETLDHNTGPAYYFMQGSHPVSPKNYISHQEKSTFSILATFQFWQTRQRLWKSYVELNRWALRWLYRPSRRHIPIWHLLRVRMILRQTALWYWRISGCGARPCNFLLTELMKKNNWLYHSKSARLVLSSKGRLLPCLLRTCSVCEDRARLKGHEILDLKETATDLHPLWINYAWIHALFFLHALWFASDSWERSLIFLPFKVQLTPQSSWESG